MSVRISYAAARQIADHAARHYPHEVCGLFAGQGAHITKAIPLDNIAAEPETHYQPDPSQQLRALKQIDSDRLQWLGIYHSHPKSPPIPSAADMQAAADESLLHLIVSLQGTRHRLKLWRITATSAVPLDLSFDTEPAAPPSPSLSAGQKAAVVIVGILSLLTLLLISFALLPPAPALPATP